MPEASHRKPHQLSNDYASAADRVRRAREELKAAKAALAPLAGEFYRVIREHGPVIVEGTVFYVRDSSPDIREMRPKPPWALNRGLPRVEPAPESFSVNGRHEPLVAEAVTAP